MNTRDWLMTKESLLDKDADEFEDLSAEERESLKLVMTELKGWVTQSVDMVLSVMAEDGVYYDITGEPAVGHEGIREFGIGWVEAVPDFKHLSSRETKWSIWAGFAEPYRRDSTGNPQRERNSTASTARWPLLKTEKSNT